MKNTIILLLSIAFISCDKISQDDLKTIEDIRLGEDYNSFKKQVDSLGVKSKRFYNIIAPRYKNNEMNDANYISTYYTNIFDFSKYKNEKLRISHPSLIVPFRYTGTNNVWSAVVLLGHTEKPWLFSVPDYLRDIYDGYDYFRQDINESALETIIGSYYEKYGIPDKIDTSNFNSYFYIDGNAVTEGLDDSRSAITYTWKTKYMDVKLFAGLDLNAIYYKNSSNYSQSTNLIFSNPTSTKADMLNNEESCRSLAYIMYQLNDKALEKLKIKVKKI